ncbi:hypothetical protein GCM10023192_64820 [Amycolatopsis samaneae]
MPGTPAAGAADQVPTQPSGVGAGCASLAAVSVPKVSTTAAVNPSSRRMVKQCAGVRGPGDRCSGDGVPVGGSGPVRTDSGRARRTGRGHGWPVLGAGPARAWRRARAVPSSDPRGPREALDPEHGSRARGVHRDLRFAAGDRTRTVFENFGIDEAIVSW